MWRVSRWCTCVPKHIRKIRTRLWKESKGLCHWCVCKTVFPRSGHDEQMKNLDLATVEHLVSRTKIRREGCPVCKGTGGDMDFAKGVMETCTSCMGSGTGFRDEEYRDEQTVLACLGCNQLRGILEEIAAHPIRIHSRD
jgi:hypothetical protein